MLLGRLNTQRNLKLKRKTRNFISSDHPHVLKATILLESSTAEEDQYASSFKYIKILIFTYKRSLSQDSQAPDT